MSQRHQSIADQLSKTFPPETIKKWEEMVKRWDKDKTAPNPYAEPHCSKLYLRFKLLRDTYLYFSDDTSGCAPWTCERGGSECCKGFFAKTQDYLYRFLFRSIRHWRATVSFYLTYLTVHEIKLSFLKVSFSTNTLLEFFKEKNKDE